VKKTKIKPPPNWEDTPQSFENFERLARAVVAVPKKELAQPERKKEGRKVTKRRVR
jgi:hypothetical protein